MLLILLLFFLLLLLLMKGPLNRSENINIWVTGSMERKVAESKKAL